MSGARSVGLLKVVLDTNVYFSAFISTGGVPFQIWRKAVGRNYALLISPSMIGELADVLRLDLEWTESEIVARLKLIVRVAKIVEPRIAVQANADDPDDDRILECAVEGKADLIVSGDRHLTRLRTFRGIAIVRPSDFLRTLGEG
jgi:uncharacterized protein